MCAVVTVRAFSGTLCPVAAFYQAQLEATCDPTE